MAKLAAWALRAAGARRTLQALKDDPRLVRLVFRPAGADELPALSEAAAARLDRCEAECRAAVAAAGEPLGDGLWLARAAPRTPERPAAPGMTPPGREPRPAARARPRSGAAHGWKVSVFLSAKPAMDAFPILLTILPGA